MKANCPNEKHPDWINIVNAVGYIDAYRLFVNNGYEIPDITPFRTGDDVLKYLDKSSLVKKNSGKYYIPYISPTSFQKKMDSVMKMVDRINTMYGGPVLIVDSIPLSNSKYNRNFAYFVDVNEEPLRDFWRGVVKRDRDGNTINRDGDIMPSYDEDVYFQLEGASLDIEDYKDFKRKSEYLLKFFPGYVIREDWKLPIPAKVNVKSRIIDINPRSITVDALGHEFGHIIIDNIGGMSNPIVKAARQQLIDSPLEKQVVDKYKDIPGMTEEKMDKEIVAQAMGLESVQIFEDEQNQSEWVRRLRKILYRIKQVLNLNTDAVHELSRKLVDKNWDKETRTTQEKIDEEFEEATGKNRLSELDIIMHKVLDSLYKKRAIRGRHGVDEKAEEITRLIRRVEQNAKKDPVLALKNFQDFAKKETDAIYLEYLEADRKKSQGEQGFSIKQLNKWKQYVAGFSGINDIILMLKEAVTDKEDPILAEKIQKVLDFDILKEIQTNNELIEKVYLKEGRDLVAKFLAKYSNHIAAQDRENYELDYNKLPAEEKQKISRENYITERERVNFEKTKARTESYIKLELSRAAKDIGTISRYLDNLLDSPDPVVASMVNAFAQTMRKARHEKYNLKDEFVEALRDLEQFQENKGFFKSEKDFYSFMLEQAPNSEGDLNYTGHIVGAFNSEFWSAYGSFINKLKRKRYTKGSFRKLVDNWKSENAPISEEAQKQYFKDRDAFIESLRVNGELTNTEVAKVSTYFKDSNYTQSLDEVINEEAAYKISDWVRDNSWNYRTPADKWKNKQWDTLLEMAGGNTNMEMYDQIEAIAKNKTNDPRIKFYNFIRDNIDKHQGRVPYIHRLHSRLPGVVKKSGEILRSSGGWQKAASSAFKETFDILADETDRGDSPVQREIVDESGKPVNFIPVHFTTRLDPSQQSFDVADIYFRYFSSAIDYSYKQEILPEMEMTRNLLNQREVLSRNSAGKVIIDHLRGKDLTQKGLNSKIAEQFQDWMEAVLYDKKKKDEGKFRVFGKDIDVAKFLDSLNKFTALNLLGFNFVQGTANVALGSTMQWIEAFGGIKGRDHYSPKDYLKAKKFYTTNLGGVLRDVGSRKPTNIITLLNREFDTLNDYVGGNLRRDTKFAQMLSADTVFFTSHAGEHMMQTKVMLAMLNRVEAKDAHGNVLGKMLDMFSVKDGKLTLDERVKNFNQDARAIFENKVKRVLSAMHGEYSEMGRVAIQRYALGRMGYMFRKFVIPGFRRRYGKRYINNMSGEVVEGTYITTKNFLVKLLKDFGQYKLAVFSHDWKELKAREKAAIVKTSAEVAFLMSAIILINTLESSDDDDIWWKEFLAYQAFRFRAEISFFINPESTMQILRSPAASMSLVENTFKFVSQLIDPVFSGQFEFDEYERGNWKGRKKITKTMINFIPGWKQFYRLKYVDDQTSWLKN